MITDDAVAQFISLSGASPDEARGYLEMAGGDLQQAVNLFLEMGGGGGAAPASPVPRPNPAPTVAGGVVDADVAAEVAAAAAAAGIDTGDTAMAEPEQEVRAPIAAYQDQIINPEHEQRRMEAAMAADSAAMSRRMTFDRGGDDAGAGAGGDDSDGDEQMGHTDGQAINQLFAPPSYNEAGSWLQTLEKAKAEGKWLLVNIQQAEVFASHTLNRDVWSDDTIKDIIEGSFLFWQRDDKSREGDHFCQYYSCGHQLPHICVVDARTGRRIKNWDGRKWVESHAAAEYLFGFLDQFSMSRSPPAQSPAGSPMMEPRTEPTGSGEMKLMGLDEPMEEAAASSSQAEPAEDSTPKEPVPALPEEPADSVEHLKVSLRLPSGQRITRRFVPTDSVEQMFVVAAALSEQPTRLVDLSTQFPKRSLRDIEGGLSTPMKDAQVAGSMILVTVRAD